MLLCSNALMVQLPTIPESATQGALVQTPFDDYELIDFGRGRKLERWGPYITETLEPNAVGQPDKPTWQADWIYIDEVGQNKGHWQATRSGLDRQWTVQLGGSSVVCQLDAQGRVGLSGRDVDPCGDGKVPCTDIKGVVVTTIEFVVDAVKLQGIDRYSCCPYRTADQGAIVSVTGDVSSR